MEIAFTYDLRDDYLAQGWSAEDAAEFDSWDTIDGVRSALESLGFTVDLIGGIRNLAEKLVAGERWAYVFNIAEGVGGYGREAQIPALLDAYGIPYSFSDPLTLAVSLHKGVAKHLMLAQGVRTAPFALIEAENDLSQLTLPGPFPLFVKPVGEGTGKGITAASKVDNFSSLGGEARALLQKYQQPLIVEPFLTGREFTVGILGTGRSAMVLGVMEILYTPGAEGNIYSYDTKADYAERVGYRLADDDEAKAAGGQALKAWRALGCQDGGRVDVRSDAGGHPFVLEVNPLAGLNSEHSDLPILARLAGWDFRQLIAAIVHSSFRRIGLAAPFPSSDLAAAE